MLRMLRPWSSNFMHALLRKTIKLWFHAYRPKFFPQTRVGVSKWSNHLRRNLYKEVRCLSSNLGRITHKHSPILRKFLMRAKCRLNLLARLTVPTHFINNPACLRIKIQEITSNKRKCCKLAIRRSRRGSRF